MWKNLIEYKNTSIIGSSRKGNLMVGEWILGSSLTSTPLTFESGLKGSLSLVQFAEGRNVKGVFDPSRNFSSDILRYFYRITI